MSKLKPSAQRVQDSLKKLGLALEVVELPASTRTAAEAAAAIGCALGQIAKSLLFRTKYSDRPVLVIASGSNRVDEKLVSAVIGEKLTIADADFVRRVTGFTIGGVPPVGHIQPIETLIDEDLHNFAEIWAAAGTPHAVFRLTGEQLLGATGGKFVAIKKALSENEN